MSDDEMVVLRFDAPARASLRESGLVLNVRVAAQNGNVVSAVALIDTGADTTCVSKAIADAIGMLSKTTEKHHVINGGDVLIEIGECALDLSGYGTVELEHAGIVEMGEAHQVIIGRDLLAHALLLVNFVKGNWELHLPSRMLLDQPQG